MVVPPGVFYRRGDGGSAVPMQWSEVREQMLFTEERRRRATLFRILLSSFAAMADRLLSYPGPDAVFESLDRFDTSAFSALFADVAPLLPSDPFLFDRLLEVSLAANRINVGLDCAVTLGKKSGLWGEEIRGNARTVGQYCRECEQLLTDALGGKAN